jgi:hypothetical protein
MPLDTERLGHLAALFHIHTAALGHPKLKPIADEAMKQLEEHAKALEPVVEEPKPEDVARVEADQGQDIDLEEAKRVRAQAAETEKVHTDTPAVTRRGVL